MDASSALTRGKMPPAWQSNIISRSSFSPDAYTNAISSQGFAQTYRNLFGDPWQGIQPHIPGSLTQPDFNLPFTGKQPWTLTGGPHTAWGNGDPLAAIDFAPPGVKECGTSTEMNTAVASGLVVRSEPAIVVLDLDSPDAACGWG